MTVKVSWLFNGGDLGGTGKVYGFSESWYTGLQGDALMSAMDEVSAKRRLILANGTSIVAYRIGQDTGRSFVVRTGFSAPRTNETGNLPVDSVLCAVGVAGSPTIKRFFFHDLPDDFIASDSFNQFNRAAVNDVILRLVAFGFQVRYQNPAAATASILGIDATGVVTTVQPIALAVGNTVQLLNCRDTNNRARRGTYVVSAVGGATSFTLAHWGGSIVGRSGKVRLVAYLFGSAVPLDVNRGIIAAASRKVGRPFFQSRGRAPVRR